MSNTMFRKYRFHLFDMSVYLCQNQCNIFRSNLIANHQIINMYFQNAFETNVWVISASPSF